MGAPIGTQGQGTLPNQVQQAYGGALGQFGNLANAGNTALAGGQGYGQQAGNVYGDFAGEQGQLATTNLQPYMNPFQQGVIDTSMNELNRQRGIALQGVDDRALAQNAFGGDRMYLERGTTAGDYARQQANTLAQLNLQNFNNAQQGAQFDIGNRLQGASGLGQLGLGWGQLGANMGQQGAAGLGDLASGGFQMANAANAAQIAAAQAQQQQQQQAIDAANANYARLLGIPQQYLQSMLGISSGLGNFGTTKGSIQEDPGMWSQIGAGAGILGAIAGLPMGIG